MSSWVSSHHLNWHKLNSPYCHKYWVVEIDFLVALLLPDDPLLAHKADGEEDVDGEVDHLGVDQGHGEVAIAGHISQAPAEVGEAAHDVRVARLVGDESLPLGRVQHLNRPLDRNPPPTAVHLRALLLPDPPGLVRPHYPGLDELDHVGEPLGESWGVAADAEDVGEEEVADDSPPHDPGPHPLGPWGALQQTLRHKVQVILPEREGILIWTFKLLIKPCENINVLT